jgi:dTDP-L-rhamnose 4-epimerase
MAKRILITGGAGFIGSHLADELLARGHTVRALDNLTEQVHGAARQRPDYLDPDVELMVGDVRDARAVRKALENVDAVYHFAAAVGVGQSMYEVAHYTEVNNFGTAVLMEALIARPVERLIVASSMSLYGEGLYRRSDGEVVDDVERYPADLKAGRWDPTSRGHQLTPVPTPEDKRPSLASIYALSKFDQERMCLTIGRTYDIPTVALRFFNAYGTRQALTNPYTGVLAIFASRLLSDSPPLVFEDGRQQRDFVSVHDVVQGCRLALEVPDAAGRVFNLASGEHLTIAEVAARMAMVLERPNIRAKITRKYRPGDIRHCVADISLARRVLGYAPQVTLEEGLQELAEWLRGQVVIEHARDASAEVTARSLAV